LKAGHTIFNSEILENFLYRDSAAAFLKSTTHFLLLTYDKQTLLLYGGKLLTSRAVLYNYVRLMQSQKQRAENLAKLITTEYDLKNE
jgi:hypothetical protein